MSYRLGDFEFLNASRDRDAAWPPLIVATLADLRQRPGADGTDLRTLGRKGTAFDWFTFVDVNDLAAGAELYRQYAESVLSGTPVDLIWAGVDYRLKYKTAYQVLYCENIELRRLVGASGGLSAQSGAYLRCRWELLPVATR